MAPTRPSIMSDGATTCAPACAWTTAIAREQLQRGVVLDLAGLDTSAAVPVGGVLAEADVGDDQQVACTRR